MKYSQVVLVACIGGATLASAVPRGDPRIHRVATKVGKTVAFAGNFAKHATGMNTPMGTNTYGNSDPSMLVKRGRNKGSGAKKSSIGQFRKAAVHAAGGPTELAKHLGSVTYYANQRKGGSAPGGSTLDDSTLTVRAPTEPKTGASAETGATGTQSDTSATELKRKNAIHRKGGRGAKGKSPPVPSPSPHPSSVSSRDFEGPWARAFDDFEFLSSRGPAGTEASPSTNSSPLSEGTASKNPFPSSEAALSSTNPSPSSASAAAPASTPNHSGRQEQRKHRKHRNRHRLVPSPSAPASSGLARSAPTPSAHAQVDPALSAPSSSAPAPSLSSRDFEDFAELDARDFGEDLEARGFFNALGALGNTLTGKQRSGATPTNGMPTGDSSTAMAARDFLEDLDARDFEIDEVD